MKAKKYLYIALMALPLVVTLIALRFLPEQIPAHYDMNHQVTRWGSKYETLIFPAITIGFGLLMLWIAKAAKRQEKNGMNNAKLCILTGLICLGLFNVMTYYFLYTDFQMTENLEDTAVDLNSLIFGVLGLGMILLGNEMPKAKRNDVLGLRTLWSQQSDAVWKLCQRFGGIASMVSGLAMIAVCFLTSGFPCMALCLGILAVMAAVDVLYSYFAAKKAPQY